MNVTNIAGMFCLKENGLPFFKELFCSAILKSNLNKISIRRSRNSDSEGKIYRELCLTIYFCCRMFFFENFQRLNTKLIEFSSFFPKKTLLF